MFPRFPFKNKKYGVLAHAVFYSQIFKACSAVSHFPYFQNIFFIKFCHAVIGAFYSFRIFMRPAIFFFRPNLPSFFNAIRSVFFRCSQKQVFWIHAFSVVAFMANAHSFWNFSVVNNPRKPVRFHVFSVLRNSAIPIRIYHFFPIPTKFGFNYRVPKPFYCVFVKLVDFTAGRNDALISVVNRIHSMISMSGLGLRDNACRDCLNLAFKN